MLYHLHELKNAAMLPVRVWSDAVNIMASSLPEELNPYGSLMTATSEMLGRSIKIFPKPEFGIQTIEREGKTLEIHEKKVMIKPFCTIRQFCRYEEGELVHTDDPKVLIVAPLSGHFATLLRDTVRRMIPTHDVYVTDWHDARHISLKEGRFSFENYVDYLLDFMRFFGRDLHVMAVCQPSVPLLSAVSLLADYNESCQPKTMTLMGGPIDTRINPGQVNQFATEHTLKWYKDHLITVITGRHAGAGRHVCPGFLMLQGFLSLNVDRHQDATFNFFQNLVKGDTGSVESHTKFYDEYRAVLDMPADYFIDSIRISFKEHLLPRGELTWRGYPVRPSKIKKTALMTVEGELDDISCVGQTHAAHTLCDKLPKSMHRHYIQEGVGHYGIFNGRRWASEIQPRIAEFIRTFD